MKASRCSKERRAVFWRLIRTGHSGTETSEWPESFPIYPEQNGPRDWTMVWSILSYRLRCLHVCDMRLFSIQMVPKPHQREGTTSSHLDLKVAPIPLSNCLTADPSGLMAIDRVGYCEG
jgi:hypothetical protein